MNSCGICHNSFNDSHLTEIGLGTNNFQCEECWNNYGEDN
jgi:hypothetical protein